MRNAPNSRLSAEDEARILSPFVIHGVEIAPNEQDMVFRLNGCEATEEEARKHLLGGFYIPPHNLCSCGNGYFAWQPGHFIYRCPECFENRADIYSIPRGGGIYAEPVLLSGNGDVREAYLNTIERAKFCVFCELGIPDVHTHLKELLLRSITGA